jgi:hypothetical protein
MLNVDESNIICVKYSIPSKFVYFIDIRRKYELHIHSFDGGGVGHGSFGSPLDVAKKRYQTSLFCKYKPVRIAQSVRPCRFPGWPTKITDQFFG